jgi:hypothetical protein
MRTTGTLVSRPEEEPILSELTWILSVIKSFQPLKIVLKGTKKALLLKAALPKVGTGRGFSLAKDSIFTSIFSPGTISCK